MSTLVASDVPDRSTDYRSISVVPQPNLMQPAEGFFHLSSSTRIVSDRFALQEADYLSTLLSQATGSPRTLELSPADVTNSIVLRLLGEACGIAREGYRL